MALPNLRAVKGDIEDIRLMMPPAPEPPTCQACGSRDCSERGHEDEGCLYCDACWEQMCPAGVDVFLASLQRDEHGNLLACSTPGGYGGS